MTEYVATPAVVGVAVIGPHVMRLLFGDGLVRDIQFVPGGGRASMIEPLADADYFARVRVDHDARTVVWPNGLDLAPEVLHGDYEPTDDLGFRDVTGDSARSPAPRSA